MHRLLSAAMSCFICTQALATPPAEMASMSIQELLSLNIDEPAPGVLQLSPWSFSLSYIGRQYDGYLQGSHEMAHQEVLFNPERNTRSHNNYPILPTEISQQASILSVTHKFSQDCHLTLDLPFIRQSTDHLSIVPGYQAFNITSEGVGDFSVKFRDVIYRHNRHLLQYSAGIAIPTGSIDKTGDTPRAAGDQQLPYTMQTGSGTWDIPLGIYYQQHLNSWSWGINLWGKVRTGKNSRDYRLGNHGSLSVWTQWHVNSYWQPIIKLELEQSSKIHGRDNDITVPGHFPYPANITDPDNFGGKKVKLGFGNTLQLSTRHKISGEFSIPVYQYANHIQVKEKAQLNLRWDVSL